MKIVAGALTTPEGELAIKHAVQEARAHPDGEVHLVAFVAAPKDDEGLESYENEVRRLKTWVAEAADELSQQEEVPVTGHVPPAGTKPSEAILSVARGIGADLIVIALRRRSRVGKLLLGSNAQDILLRADCPVLGVKLPADQE